MWYDWTFLNELVRYTHDRKGKYQSKKTPAKVYDGMYWNKEIIVKRF